MYTTHLQNNIKTRSKLISKQINNKYKAFTKTNTKQMYKKFQINSKQAQIKFITYTINTK